MGLALNGAAFVVAISVSALSVGALDTFKAFVSGFYPPRRITELYATISLVETVVHVVSSRMWTSVLVESLGLGGVRMGLPYFVSAGFSLVGYTLIYAMARYNRYDEV
ncbi:hypothetical protein J3458_019983 [Metarhizium acridum]|uniref:uncharacterized protein n=1 Tax=Metarhizium acridum TaxID=92637 RepID=UPI001C6B51A4|nr:hypothetical protein J3458_019983 [Metarhizium acridum]